MRRAGPNARSRTPGGGGSPLGPPYRRREERRKELRAGEPACFSLLYRRDREWLEANSPACAASARGRSVVDWAGRDAEAAEAIEAAAWELGPGRPRKRAVRPTTLARRADVLALVQQHAGRMPRATAALARLSENPLALAGVRLEKAPARRIVGGLDAPAVSVLARDAGLGERRAGQLADAITGALERIAAAAF